MADLISRAAAIAKVERARKAARTLTGMDFVMMLKDQPTVDAVPVIRCRDCKYWDGRGKCRINNGYHSWVKDAWYCADGERREIE